jgi:hypothetical protein
MIDIYVDPIALAQYRADFDANILPPERRKWYDSAPEEKLDKWFRGRFKCMKSHLYLSDWVEHPETGKLVPISADWDFQSNPHSILFSRFVQKRPGEGFVLSDLESLTKKMMILWPRGTFKSSAVVVDIVQTILNYPNVRICFLTGGEELGMRRLKQIKRIFENPTETFAYLFPEFCFVGRLDQKSNNWGDVNAKMGNQHEFTVPCRTNETFPEPTFSISTAKCVKAGAHFDIIYIDDLVNETNYKSIPALEKCYQDYIDICPMLEPTGYIVMTGTRYSWGDTYERIQENAREEEKQLGHTVWAFSIQDCWSYACANCNHPQVYHDTATNILHPLCMGLACKCPGFVATGDRGLLFPETRAHDGRAIGHTLGGLESFKIQYGEEFFANQYENRPIAAQTQVFTDALIGAQTLFDINAIPGYSQSYTFVVGDLAYVGQEDRDFSVIFVCRLFQGQIFIYDCLFGNWDSGEVAKITVDVLLTHRPRDVFYEQFNGWDAYQRLIESEAKKRHIENLPVQWLKCSRTADAKKIRIGTVKGFLAGANPNEHGRLWFYRNMGGKDYAAAYDNLVKQLVRWPKLGRHDDFADCAGQVVQAPTGFQLQEPPPVPTVMNWLRKLNAAQTVEEPDSRPAGSYGSDEDDRWK